MSWFNVFFGAITIIVGVLVSTTLWREDYKIYAIWVIVIAVNHGLDRIWSH
jgi:hypothetical protein